jgi:diaminohydroxyphosphoribosylaminopyrimidine deaminase / 5-amino-6-(5-phosphoribosylamino)uracil reductase
VSADAAYMARALALAQAQAGRTRPNPSVGCVLVRDGAVIGEGATGDGGRPHSEELALLAAGSAFGACAYVTLEPCGARSSGQAGCAQRLIEAGVARVVCAIADPHPKGAGGFRRLEAAGIPVLVGIGEARAKALYQPFFHRVATGRALALIDNEGIGFEGEVALHPRETALEALERLGAEGYSKVFARPGTPAAAALSLAGLIGF